MDGNCLSAAVASILEMSIEDIPDFREGAGLWFFRWQEWLQKRGQRFVIYDKFTPPRGYSIGEVMSPTMEGEKHSVVCFDGKVVYDPLPPHDRVYDLITEFWAIEPSTALSLKGASGE